MNRRAQYGLFASYVIAVTGALFGLLLIIVARADPAGFAVLRSAIAEVTRPVSGSLQRLVSGVGSLDENIVAYVNAGSQNAALRRQVDANRTRLIEAAAIEQENLRLKKLLNLVQNTQGNLATARLIGSTTSITRRIARIDAGRSRGVLPGMPVRAPEGLIGRVIVSGPNTADVLLLTDSQNIIPVRRAKDNIAAICTGLDDGTVEIRPLNPGNNPFRPGDIMVTTGTGGLYSPNIPVAIVVSQRNGMAIGVPLASPARVEAVVVQRPYDIDLAPPLDQGDAPRNEADAAKRAQQK
ncbi:rod shape-determining protein MreC [Sphingobium subterraneum]|uniref:Cell shape-determining protein MreC n=1 Tax=Sphingobium subterraneum TaxID=627688 RepID=A0A841J744_9SPHN|nr:rod shape-determining protein MreC [Sphingobium subterraneum]